MTGFEVIGEVIAQCYEITRFDEDFEEDAGDDEVQALKTIRPPLCFFDIPQGWELFVIRTSVAALTVLSVLVS